MLKTVRNQVARLGDRMLERVAPKMAADAQCGAWIYCCGYDSSNRLMLGQLRRDVEHGAYCTPCFSLGVPC